MTFAQALEQLATLRREQSAAARAGIHAGVLGLDQELQSSYAEFRAVGDRLVALETELARFFSADELRSLRLESIHLTSCKATTSRTPIA